RTGDTFPVVRVNSLSPPPPTRLLQADAVQLLRFRVVEDGVPFEVHDVDPERRRVQRSPQPRLVEAGSTRSRLGDDHHEPDDTAGGIAGACDRHPGLYRGPVPAHKTNRLAVARQLSGRYPPLQ